MEKFEVLKDSIKESGDKLNSYQEEVEEKKMEIQLLETEIVNLQNAIEKDKTISTGIKEEKTKLEK